MSRSSTKNERVSNTKKNSYGWNKESSVEVDNNFLEMFETTDLGQSLSADIAEISEIVSDHILVTMRDTYKLAGEASRDNPNNHFKTFQVLLKDYKDWESSTKKRLAKKVRRKLPDIDSLVHSAVIGIAQFRYMCHAKNQKVSKKDCNRVIREIAKSNIVPTTEDFLHWATCRAVRDVYRYPYYFDIRNTVSTKQKDKNTNELIRIIRKAVSEEAYSRASANYLIQSAIHAVQKKKGGKIELSESDSEVEEPEKNRQPGNKDPGHQTR